MKATLDIPEEIAEEVRRRAVREGKGLDEQLVQLLKLGLLVQDVPVAGNALQRGSPVVSVDPGTGLPVIDSPPDAPIHTMTASAFLALVEQTQSREDLDRAGLPVRQ